jgi:replicative DNA helicase
LEINDDFLEKLIFKGILTDRTYLILISNAFIPEYFQNDTVGKVFQFTKEYFEEYRRLPTKDVVVNSVEDNDLQELYTEVEQIDFDISQQYDFLIDASNKYLKDQAIKKAMVDSIRIIDTGEDIQTVRARIEDALSKDLKIDLGLDYFGDLGSRLTRIFNASSVKVPTYYPTFDELINGGFPPFTLSVLCARIHGFKSNTMANWAARQVLHGHNVVILTLEMSEDAFASRFDAIYSMLDINRMYLTSNKRRLIDKLVEIKNTQGRGTLKIKQFPTGAASTADFRRYLRELAIRGESPEIIYVDYINLMRAELKKQDGNMYSSVKAVAEELRALSFEFEAPVVSVSQLNREGSFVGFEELDFTFIAESLGVPATADFMSIIGVNEDKLVYESELHNKLVKNRLGGRVGDIWRCYYDSRTLKMYDEVEQQMWLDDAEQTGDARNPFTAPAPQENNNRRRRRR